MKFIKIIALCWLLCNCSARKDVRYLQNVSPSDVVNIQASAVPVFQSNDVLRIIVTTENNVGVAPFNLSTRSYISSNEESTESSELFYLVDQYGNIEFPVIGEIQVAGRTKEELKEIIKDKLEPHLINPFIHIEMLNFKISILGDVSSPGVYKVDNEKINILEAIALAGDLNISALRNNILVIREVDGITKFEELNLLDDSIFSSPYFYLRQNDIIYVKPNNIRTREASWESRIPLITSISTFLLSIVILFVR